MDHPTSHVPGVGLPVQQGLLIGSAILQTSVFCFWPVGHRLTPVGIKNEPLITKYGSQWLNGSRSVIFNFSRPITSCPILSFLFAHNIYATCPRFHWMDFLPAIRTTKPCFPVYLLDQYVTAALSYCVGSPAFLLNAS